MRVRIDIGLDFEGVHTFRWQPSEAPGSVDIPEATLKRWSEEREAFAAAYLRWERVVEEFEDHLYTSEHDNPFGSPVNKRQHTASSNTAEEPAYAVVGAKQRKR